MKKFFLIARREWLFFFHTPYAIMVLPLYLILVGIYFYAKLDAYLNLSRPTEVLFQVAGLNVHTHLLTPFFRDLLNVFVFLVPVITMRTFAEEKKLGTYELLVSYPVRPWQLLLGKYCGALWIVMFLMVLSLPFFGFVFWKGEPYLPQVAAGYLGLFLFLMVYVAIGVVGSLLTESQIVAALIAYGGFFSTILLQWLAYISASPWDRFFSNYLVVQHVESFRQGLVFSGDIVVYLSVTIMVLSGGHWKLKRHFVK